MNVVDYYNAAKEIGEMTKRNPEPILVALSYNVENEHPSKWIPNVQSALIDLVKESSDSEISEKALKLFVQGEILTDFSSKYHDIKRAILLVMLGVLVGWVIWG